MCGMLSLATNKTIVATLLKQYKTSDQKYDVLKEVMYKATAFLVSQKQKTASHRGLLRLLCHDIPLEK